MSFLDGFMRRNVEIERLQGLEKELQNARLQGLDHCVKCGWCCNRRSCIPTPDELRKIAEFLGMTPTELIKTKYAIDYIESDEYFVKPLGLNILDLAGELIPYDRTYDEGDCIFLDEKRECSIYEVQPRVAREYGCWIQDEDAYSPLDEWKDNKLREEFGVEP